MVHLQEVVMPIHETWDRKIMTVRQFIDVKGAPDIQSLHGTKVWTPYRVAVEFWSRYGGLWKLIDLRVYGEASEKHQTNVYGANVERAPEWVRDIVRRADPTPDLLRAAPKPETEMEIVKRRADTNLRVDLKMEKS
jgi:hypothetical protein